MKKLLTHGIIKSERGEHTMENKIIENWTDKDGNKWEIKIMKNLFVNIKYKVLYKNGKKIEILGRI